LSDRGPGGGTLDYNTRAQRFTLDVNAETGAISNFRIVETVIFKRGASALNGLAPQPASSLGLAFDPAGMVVNPRTGTLLVSDEYGPSLREFSRSGALIRTFTTPANLLPRDAATGATNHASDAGNTAGKRSNRGMEGLAIGPKLANGNDLLLASTDIDIDNDDSASQNGSHAQFDVWFDFSTADPYASSIQCPLDSTQGCVTTSNGTAALWSPSLQLLPGVLHAYTISAAELNGYTAPVPEPRQWALLLAGLLSVGLVKRRADRR